MTDHADLTARLRDPWGTVSPGELVDIYDLAERAADALDAADAENERLRGILIEVRAWINGDPNYLSLDARIASVLAYPEGVDGD